MPITIRKDQDGTKFYCNQLDSPVVVIYNGSKVAILNDQIIDNIKLSSEIAQALLIAGLFVQSELTAPPLYKKNVVDVMYFNEGDLTTEDTKYSARKILVWLESDKIVTINKSKRIRYQFTKFAFQNDKLIILYKPVAW